jgi:transketolase
MTTVAQPSALYDCRDAFAEGIEALAAADERVVVVCNDSVASSKLGGFKTKFPDRLVNVGIAEQVMVGVASGLANGGKRPFVAGASCFLTARALEQIKVDLAYTNANVKLCAMSPGVAYGEFGPTHHSIEDIAWLRAIDNLVLIVPADPLETAQALDAAAEHEGPVFIRVSRMGVPAVHGEDYRFQIGRATRLGEGRDVTLIANGTMVSRALEAATLLNDEGIGARVVSMPTVKPLDLEEIAAAAEETGAIVTVEEHSVHGGLGGAVAEAVVAALPVPMRILGFPGFAPTGSAEWLLGHFGLDALGIRDAAAELVRSKRR